MGVVILMPQGSLFPRIEHAVATQLKRVLVGPTAHLDALEKREMSFSVLNILNQIAPFHSLRVYIF